ncbi:hypothetical protein ScPMuIL_006564 [Solemya velum]
MDSAVDLISEDEQSYLSIQSDDSCIIYSPSVNKMGTFEDLVMTPPPRHPLLESVSARFEHNRQEMDERINTMRTRREVEVAHCEYLKKNVASPEHTAEAKSTVMTWANKHNIVERANRRMLKAKRSPFPRQSWGGNSSIEIISPSSIPDSLAAQYRNKTSNMTRGSSNSNLCDSVKSGPSCVTSKSDLYRCAVLNCEVPFSSRLIYSQHQSEALHTPCNPLRLVSDNRVSSTPVAFMCPKCNLIMNTEEECKKHMKEKKHLVFLDPLQIGGYMCPQCLLIFPETTLCWKHMDSYRHSDIVYPFQDDMSLPNDIIKPPVPVSVQLCHDFQIRCLQVPMTISCVDCSQISMNQAELNNHQELFRDSHILSCSAPRSIVEVFSDYLTGYSCEKCASVCPSPKEKQDHQCCEAVTGVVIEKSATSFTDFVKCCGLSLRVTKKDAVRSHNVGVSVEEKTYKDATNHFALLPTSQVETFTKGSGITKGHSLLAGSSQNNNGHTNYTNAYNNAIRSPKRHCRDYQGPYQRMGSPTKKTKCCNIYSQEESSIRECIDLGGAKDTVPILTNSCTETEFDRCLKEMNESQQSSCPTRDCRAKGECSMMSSFNNAVKSIFHCSCSKEKEGNVQNINSSKEKPRVVAECSSTKLNLRDSKFPVNIAAQSSGADNIDQIIIGITEAAEGPSSKTLGTVDVDSTIEITGYSAAKPRIASPVAQENLETMKHIIFLDIDNWPKLFQKLPTHLPEKTFVWGFFGGANVWSEPMLCPQFAYQKKNGWFHLHDQCGRSKDAADFAICLTVGRMDERLPKSIPFTILSGDKGFNELERQMKNSDRRAVVIDPHTAQKFSGSMIYTMITSVTDV